MPRLALHWKILIGLVLGVAVGLLLNATGDAILAAAGEAGPARGAIEVVIRATEFVGKLFLRALQFLAVPIVLFSLVVGAASLGDLTKLGRLGGRTVLIYTVTTAVAISIGLSLANAIGPGRAVDTAVREEQMEANRATVATRVEATRSVQPIDQQLLDLVPANPFAALAQGNMLQVIVFALALGIGLTFLPRERAWPVMKGFDALADATMALVGLVLRLAPYAVFALVAPVIARMGVPLLTALLAYCATLVLGLLIVLTVVYPTLLRVFAGIGPRRFYRAMAEAQLMAFSTSSSNATLPVTMRCARDKLGVPEDITSFVCPLGATINMDGTAMYQGVATVFIAQMYGMDLSFADQLTVVLTATLASIGTPGIPGAGVVMLVVVLNSVGVPPDGIAVILGVDRILDMCRTVVNVTGDAMTAAIIARGEGRLAPAP